MINKYVNRDFATHPSRIKVLSFSSDSRRITSIPENGIVRILDIVNGTSEDVCDLGHEELSSAAISPDNRLIAGAHGAVIQIWDLESKQLVGALHGHRHDVKCIMFTPDGKGLVSGSDDETLKYWHVGGLTAAGVISPVNGPRTPNLPVSNQSSQFIIDIKHEVT